MRQSEAAPENGPRDRIGPAGQRAVAYAGVATVDEGAMQKSENVMREFNAQFKHMDDTPLCDICGSITVRSGTCYKCFNCGNAMGCG
jgi:ribonucleoside-diphosphate reductase alpha chain